MTLKAPLRQKVDGRTLSALHMMVMRTQMRRAAFSFDALEESARKSTEAFAEAGRAFGEAARHAERKCGAALISAQWWKRKNRANHR